MSNILNFNKWSKLHEAEMAAEAKPTSTYSKLQTILNNKDVTVAVKDFWNLSKSVGGIINSLNKQNPDLKQTKRALIASDVKSLLGTQHPVTVEYFKKWGDSTTWESFKNLFKDEPGKAEGLTDDFRNDFNMPKLASRQ